MARLYTAGGNVKMRFNKGAVELYSEEGILWPNWLERAGIDRDQVRSVRVMEGVVRLPENSCGINKSRTHLVFGGLRKAVSIDLSGFNTSNVTDMNHMFYNCGELTSLDLSRYDTSNVTNLNGMFTGCKKLTNLNLSSFDT